MQLTVANWLSTEQRIVDAVVLSSREARRRSDFDLQLLNAKAQTLKPYTLNPDKEDKSLWFVLDVPVKIPGFPEFGSRRHRS